MSLTRFYFTERARPLLEVGLGSTVFDAAAALWDVSLWDAPTSLWNGDEPLWRDFSCYGISAHIEAGRGRVSDSFPVGRCEIVVDNTDGWADPTLQFEVDSEPGYITFDGGLGEITVPDAAALDLTGDFTILARVFVATDPSVESMFVRKGAPLDSTLAYRMMLMTNTDFQSSVSSDGTAAGLQSFQTAALPRAVGIWRWIAFAFDANDGAGGSRGSHWYGGVEPDTVLSWQHVETGITFTTMSIFNSSAPLGIGYRFPGRISHIEIRNGNGGLDGSGRVTVGGTPVFKFDGWQLSDDDVGASTLRAATGQTMTVVPDGSSMPTVTPAVNPAGEFLLSMRPGRPIRVGVEHDTFGQRWRFNGFIDEIVPVDDPTDWSTVIFRCIDALGEAGRAKLISDVETGSGEFTKGRFRRILDEIRWPSTKRYISAAAVRQLYAAELDGQVVDLLRQTAESEGGWAFGDDQGRVVLRDRDWLYHVDGEAPDGIIGNLGGEASDLLLESGGDLLLEQGDEMLLELTGDEVCPGRWERSFARADITTVVTLDRDYPDDVTPEAPVRAIDRPGRVLYGDEPFERLDLWTEDRRVLVNIASRILATRAAALSMPRISAVTIAAERTEQTDTDLAVDLLSDLSIFTPSRYECRLRNDRGTVFDANFFAVGIIEDISAEAWTAQISLDRTRPYGVLDAVDYVWDTARWDHSLWN